MSEAAVKRGGGGGAGGGDDDAGAGVVPAAVIAAVDPAAIQAVYLSSARLGADAVVDFVRALTAVSQDELRDARAPRVFSLTKIVEVAHFNMGRIRLVWGRIWAVLSDHFVLVGCHANLGVAMYAVDSLRQLATKFLARDELARYTFQTDFLRPFVLIMRQSQVRARARVMGRYAGGAVVAGSWPTQQRTNTHNHHSHRLNHTTHTHITSHTSHTSHHHIASNSRLRSASSCCAASRRWCSRARRRSARAGGASSWRSRRRRATRVRAPPPFACSLACCAHTNRFVAGFCRGLRRSMERDGRGGVSPATVQFSKATNIP